MTLATVVMTWFGCGLLSVLAALYLVMFVDKATELTIGDLVFMLVIGILGYIGIVPILIILIGIGISRLVKTWNLTWDTIVFKWDKR